MSVRQDIQRTPGLPGREGVIGFESCTDDGCLRLLAKYEDGIAQHGRGEVNYPCGSSVRAVRHWRNELLAEIHARGLTVAA